jgi:hypothetical protein
MHVFPARTQRHDCPRTRSVPRVQRAMLALVTAATVAIPVGLIGAAPAAAFSSEPMSIVGTNGKLSGTEIWYNRSVGLAGNYQNYRNTGVTVCFYGDDSSGRQTAKQCRYVKPHGTRGFSFTLSPDAPRAIDAVYPTVDGAVFAAALNRPGFTTGPKFKPTY